MRYIRNIFKFWFITIILLNLFSLSNTYIILPIYYLPKENYIFLKKAEPSNIMKQMYYKRLITYINIGTPEINQLMLLDTDSSRFYLSSLNPPTISEKIIKKSEFYFFGENLFFNENNSNTFIKEEIKENKYDDFDEIWLSKDIINFNFGKFTKKIKFPIKILKNEDEPIPGTIGLSANNSHSHNFKSFITELKLLNLIKDYYYFFDFNKWSPLDYNIKANLIIGDLPHNIYPDKYNKDDFIQIQAHSDSSFWSHNMHKIKVESKINEEIQITNTKTHLFYEFYNIIGTPEFRNIIKELFMDKLIQENKCFKEKFSQNIFSFDDLSFYYCTKDTENILIDNLSNIKFISNKFDYIFELTKDELYYKKENFIYFTILFFEKQYNDWILGQIFTSKYNFVFHTDSRQISFYKKVNNNNNDNLLPFMDDKNNKKIWTIIIITALIFIFFGIIIGIVIGIKFIKNKKKKRAEELIDEDYDYVPKNENININ